jgi:hypothetical protein
LENLAIIFSAELGYGIGRLRVRQHILSFGEGRNIPINRRG